MISPRRASRRTAAVLPALRATDDKSASGSSVKRCPHCRKTERDIKETIHNGMQLLRVRYGLPYSELPDCDPAELQRFLGFLLLQGQARASVAFPRCQRAKRVDKDGLCNLQRLGRRDRWELAHSLSSIKRNLPAGCRLHMPSMRSQWEQNAFSQPPPISDEYLAHVRRVATRLFRPGWDKNYPRFVSEHVPNPTARFPSKSRACDLWKGYREEFLEECLNESEVIPLFKARLREVPTAGKVRPLLIYDEHVDLLGPLHRLIYSHLERTTDWLLSGPPTEDRITSTCVNAHQTSVDLVAATDGLYHSVAETLLDCLFFTSVKIPRSLRALAKASLSPLVVDGERMIGRVSHGQMMGAYLSFPLLCLQSYCAASWAARFDGKARFLVNGDDCVISASRAVLEGEYPQGFRLNNTKTIRSMNVCEVNSTAFLRTNGRWREVRHLRRGGATTSYEGMMHMAKAVSSRPCWTDAWNRCRIGRRWGFLPSQIGHWTYSSYKRERTMLNRRYSTALPVPPSEVVPASLRSIPGRGPRPSEAEALRCFQWAEGRWGGLKRDVWSPSPGAIRRTYAYRSRPAWSYPSYAFWKERRAALSRSFVLVPDNFETEEESLGLFVLDLWRQAAGSLVE